eukprot:2376241-Pyramimonas_sp.AAC.1
MNSSTPCKNSRSISRMPPFVPTLLSPLRPPSSLERTLADPVPAPALPPSSRKPNAALNSRGVARTGPAKWPGITLVKLHRAIRSAHASTCAASDGSDRTPAWIAHAQTRPANICEMRTPATTPQ